MCALQVPHFNGRTCCSRLPQCSQKQVGSPGPWHSSCGHITAQADVPTLGHWGIATSLAQPIGMERLAKPFLTEAGKQKKRQHQID